MSNARFFAAILGTALITGTVVAGVTLAQPAHAEGPRVSECAIPFGAGQAPLIKNTQAWVDQQLAAGKTQFASLGQVVCAW